MNRMRIIICKKIHFKIVKKKYRKKNSWNPLTTDLCTTYYITTEYNCKQTELSFKSKADVFLMYKKILRYYTSNSKRANDVRFSAEFRWIFARPQFTQITLRINENCSGGVERRMVNLQQVWLKKSCIEFHKKNHTSTIRTTKTFLQVWYFFFSWSPCAVNWTLRRRRPNSIHGERRRL